MSLFNSSFPQQAPSACSIGRQRGVSVARVAELADARDLGSRGVTVGVQLPPLAPYLDPAGRPNFSYSEDANRLMKLEVTELGFMKRSLKIEIPADEVNLRFVQAYSELNKQVHIPGFRAGKAPLQLLEKRYAKTVEEDVIRALVPDYYDRAIRQAGIVPVWWRFRHWNELRSRRIPPLPLPPRSKSSRQLNSEIIRLQLDLAQTRSPDHN